MTAAKTERNEEIRRRYGEDPDSTYVSLGAEYGVRPGRIHQIVRGSSRQAHLEAQAEARALVCLNPGCLATFDPGVRNSTRKYCSRECWHRHEAIDKIPVSTAFLMRADGYTWSGIAAAFDKTEKSAGRTLMIRCLRHAAKMDIV